MVIFLRTLFVICSIGMATVVTAQSSFEQDYDALSQQLARVNAEAGENPFARLERLQAAQAMEAAGLARKRDRDDALALAAIQISIADYGVRSAYLNQQLQQLDRERDAILLEASRRDAELARQEAERLRLQVLAREEEEALAAAAEPTVDPANAPDPATQNLTETQQKDAALARLEEELSEQISRKGDILAKRTGPGPTGYILSGAAFQPGKAVLNADARIALQQLAKRLKTGGKSWDIVGFTDNLGDEDSNVQISRKRAEVVLSLFRAAGMPSARLSAVGKGSMQPLSSNASKAGRAQNRRVEILQK